MLKTIQIGKTQWIYIQEPDREIINKLAQEYDFHEVIVDDLMEINAQSKIDNNSKHFFLALTFTKYLNKEQKYILNELDVIIWDNYIITTTSLESQTFNYLCESIKSESQEEDEEYKTSPYYILYRIIDTFYDKTIKSLAISSKELLTIQNNIADRKIEKWLVEDLLNHELNKIFIKHNFLSQDDIIIDLISHVRSINDKHLNMYFNSLKVKLRKVINIINVLSERIDSLMWAYDTFVGIKRNDIMTRLTFVNAIFMPLALIAGIWWMSERSMMTGPDNRKFTYPIFLVLCVVIAYITFIILRKYFLKR